MKRVRCEACDRFEFRQAYEAEPANLRPSLAEVLTIAVVFGAYFMAMAWVWASV